MSEENNKQFSEEEINYFYEKAEMDQLMEGLKRSHAECFRFMMMLIKQGLMSKKQRSSPIHSKKIYNKWMYLLTNF